MKKLFFIICMFFSYNTYAQIQSYSVESAQAIYLYNFTRYIDWSESNIGTNDFVISVIGTNSAYFEIKKYMDGKVVVNRPIKVVQIKDINELEKSEIIYFSNYRYKLIYQIKTKFNNENILFVTENEEALKNGSCINFWMDGDKLAFEINKINIQKQNLRMSISLMNTAKSQN